VSLEALSSGTPSQSATTDTEGTRSLTSPCRASSPCCGGRRRRHRSALPPRRTEDPCAARPPSCPSPVSARPQAVPARLRRPSLSSKSAGWAATWMDRVAWREPARHLAGSRRRAVRVSHGSNLGNTRKRNAGQRCRGWSSTGSIMVDLWAEWDLGRVIVAHL
jgi:hypothetical protein